MNNVVLFLYFYCGMIKIKDIRWLYKIADLLYLNFISFRKRNLFLLKASLIETSKIKLHTTCMSSSNVIAKCNQNIKLWYAAPEPRLILVRKCFVFRFLFKRVLDDRCFTKMALNHLWYVTCEIQCVDLKYTNNCMVKLNI